MAIFGYFWYLMLSLWDRFFQRFGALRPGSLVSESKLQKIQAQGPSTRFRNEAADYGAVASIISSEWMPEGFTKNIFQTHDIPVSRNITRFCKSSYISQKRMEAQAGSQKQRSTLSTNTSGEYNHQKRQQSCKENTLSR